MKTRLISLLFIATILVAGCKSGNKETQESAPAPVTETKAPALAFDPATLGEEPVFDIVTSKGTIKIKLYKETPLHRDNFVKLASDKLAKVVTSRDFIENDIGIAVASMTYQATDLGYGSCILGAFNGKEVCKAIGLDEKKSKDVKLILAIGKRATEEIREKNRKDIDDTVIYLD